MPGSQIYCYTNTSSSNSDEALNPVQCCLGSTLCRPGRLHGALTIKNGTFFIWDRLLLCSDPLVLASLTLASWVSQCTQPWTLLSQDLAPPPGGVLSIARKKPQQNRPNLHPHLSLLPLQQFISSLLSAAWLVARWWSTVTADSQVLQMGVGDGVGVEVGTQEPL